MSHAEHEWAREQIAAHLAGGLSAEERARLEAHVHTCAECIAEIDGARRFEASMETLFAPARPKPGLEDRVIRGLRSRPARRGSPPPRALMWIAATLLLGVMGYVILELEAPRSSPAAARSVAFAPQRPRPVLEAPAAEARGDSVYAFSEQAGKRLDGSRSTALAPETEREMGG
ncbi:MAG TPA: zf-HC2 domain-containing protein, partial [Planctomycetota bacterium]|nr:zf-HC2 domain-containing protein [Planctomycetota bacterium]